MVALLNVIGFVAGIGSLVCFVLVLIQMFQRGQTGLGIACIVLLCVCGIGGLVAFVYGWINVKAWNIQNVMLAWTACIAVGIVVQLILVATGAAVIPQFPGR
jgi:hypothetical protein